MPLYEHVFMARQDISSQQVETLTDQFKTIVTENGGSVGKVEYWGLRSLAFKIKKNRKAHYSLINFDAPHAAIAEMERQMRLNDDIIRFMTLRVEEHDEGQSAVLQNRGGRDDRRPPRRDGRDGGRGDRDNRGDRDRGERPQASSSSSSEAPAAAAPAEASSEEK